MGIRCARTTGRAAADFTVAGSEGDYDGINIIDAVADAVAEEELLDIWRNTVGTAPTRLWQEIKQGIGAAIGGVTKVHSDETTSLLLFPPVQPPFRSPSLGSSPRHAWSSLKLSQLTSLSLL